MLGLSKQEKADDLRSRQAVLWLAPSALTAFMKSLRWVIVKNHLPEDTQFHHVFWSPERQVWGLVVTSSRFKKVYIGQQIPELPMMEFKYFDPAVHGPVPPDQRPPETPAAAEGNA